MYLKKGIALLSALALVLLMSGLAVTQRGAVAQDMAMGAHPAHIHAGTCAELGDVVFPLSDVSAAWLVEGTPMAGDDMMGSDAAIPVMVSVTTVGAPLADIVGGGHAINIHESAENIGTYIACGDIGGAGMGTTDLAIGLGELNDSGYSGVVRLTDLEDGTTRVTVYLMSMGGMEM